MFDANTFWLKINYFVLANRNDFKKWWMILLIAATVFVVVFTFTNGILYAVGTQKHNNLIFSMSKDTIDYNLIKERNIPIPIKSVDTTILSAANGKFDVVAHLMNSNTNWAVESIEYKFVINGQETEVFTDYIMPQSDKYLTISGVEVSGEGNQVSLALDIVKLNWKRVVNDEDLLPINFSVENIEYSSLLASNGSIVSSVKADIKNNSFRSFWSTKFVVVLYSNDIIAGLDYAYFDKFETGEATLLNSRWDNVSYPITSTVILPDMNLLDLENLMN
ncbi:MAG: hypothetical protein ACNFW9_03135 [Candidatus Kerfeldbacteria bacterium]